VADDEAIPRFGQKKVGIASHDTLAMTRAMRLSCIVARPLYPRYAARKGAHLELVRPDVALSRNRISRTAAIVRWLSFSSRRDDRK